MRGGFLSHPLDTCCVMNGITRSLPNPLTAQGCLRYSADFGVQDPPFTLALSLWFHGFPCDWALRAFPSQGVLPNDVRNGIHFLIRASQFLVFPLARSPWASISVLWSRSSSFLAGYKLPLSRGLPDSSLFTSFWSLSWFDTIIELWNFHGSNSNHKEAKMRGFELIYAKQPPARRSGSF